MNPVLDRLYRKARAKRIPMVGSVELTWRCNFNCVHCFQGGMRGALPELSTADWLHLLDELAAAGTLHLTMTGGEPLARADFGEIYRHAHERGFLITLFSNASLLCPDHLELLEQRPPRLIEVSLYGAGEANYAAVTGVPGAFGLVVENLRALTRRKLPLRLKTVALRPLAGEIHTMRALAEGLGVPFRWDTSVMPRLDGNPEPLAWRLAAEEIVTLERTDERTSRVRAAGRSAAKESLLHCEAASTAFNIDPSGNVSPCVLLRSPSVDSREVGFLNAWSALESLATTRRSMAEDSCGACALFGHCSSCPGAALLERRALDAPVEHHCAVARRRSELERTAT